MPRHSILALLALPLLLGLQTGTPTVFGGGVQLPAGGLQETLGTTVPADLDGTTYEDLAFLLGTELRVAHDPGSFDALTTVASDVSDADAIATGFAVPAQALVVSRADGVHVAWFTRDAGVVIWASQPISLAPEHAGARRVRARDVDGMLGPDVVVLSASGTRVGVLHDAGGGAWVHDPGEDILLGEPALAMEVYRPTAAGPADVVALAVAHGLELWSLSTGERITRLDAGPLDSTALERLTQRTLQQEWIAWLVTDPTNGVQFLTVHGETTVQTVYLPGESGIPAMDAGDHDGDGKDDLLLNNAALYQATVIYDQSPPGAPPSFGSFAQGGALTLDVPGHSHGISSPGPATLGKPAFLDLENDGDLDVCHPSEGDDHVAADLLTFFESDLAPAGLHQPTLGGLPAASQGSEAAVLDLTAVPHQLSFTIHVPQPPPAAATALVVRDFRKPDLASPTTPDPESTLVLQLVPGQASYPVTLEIDEPSGPPYASVHFLHATLADLEGLQVEQGFPPVEAAFLSTTTGTSEGLELIEYVVDLQLPGTPPIPVVVVGSGNGSTDFSGIYLIGCIPDFPYDQPPTPLWQ